MEIKNLKKLEEAEIEVVLFDKNDIVMASCCLAAGTGITMADGSIRNIEDVREGDVVLTFDHEAGRLVGNAILHAYKSDAQKCAFTLRFDNGAALSVVGEHDLFEQESRKYVTIAEDGAEQFVGKHFYNAADESFVELVSVTYETEMTDYYELYTEKALNMIANGMLNAADDVDHLLNIYEFNDDLSANMEVLARDIQKCGLFAFSEKYGFTRHEFDAWNVKYVNISVEKGFISMDELWNQHFDYLNRKDHGDNSKCA